MHKENFIKCEWYLRAQVTCHHIIDTWFAHLAIHCFNMLFLQYDAINPWFKWDIDIMIPSIKVAFWVSYAKLLQLELALEKDRMIVRCKGRFFRLHMASNVKKQVFQASCHGVFLLLYTRFNNILMAQVSIKSSILCTPSVLR